jgi:flagellar hook-associated protein 2
MGTTSSTPSTSVTAPQYFTGVSQYSSDFQSIIQRAVQIAQLPVTQLQNDETTNTNKVQELQTLNPEVAALASDVTTLGTLASSGGLEASSSNSDIVSVINTGATAPATYTISDITSLASAASETSLAGYTATQSVSASGLVNLVVGSKTYQLNLTGTGENNVNGLATAINNANAGVNATVLTTGSNDYLVVSANNPGATTLQLNAVTPTDLISSSGTGTETSLQTYANQTSASVSATGQVQLVVGSENYSLNVSGNNNLNGLVQAINNAGAGVTASVTGSSGAYSLSLTASGGPTTIQLNDLQSPTNLISDTNQGSNAQFKVNGASVTQSGNTITNVIPGVSFTLENTDPTGSVTLSLASNASSLSSTLQSFVSDYNTLATEAQKQYGTSAGPLDGDSIMNQISEDMLQLVTYYNPKSTSSIRSLSDLGITFNDNTGQLSFNASTLEGLSNSQASDAFAFLGSSTTGFAALASNFTALSDPITGAIQSEETGLNNDNTQLGDQITTLNTRISQLQAAVTTQAQQADALCAQLESQQNTLDASIESLNYVLYGKPTSSSSSG